MPFNVGYYLHQALAYFSCKTRLKFKAKLILALTCKFFFLMADDNKLEMKTEIPPISRV